uniref:Putative leucine-rich repeat domain, L domain-like protein n=1 Tax=Helianthus annuus TaxID=4232 RepID=A0A251VRQ1_HELAN
MPFSLVNSRSISSLVLRNNSFSGLIDLNCSAMVNLKLLDLVDNKFTGSIPNNLPACPLLKTIDLGGNNLTGQISETFKNFNSLCYLSLSMCSLNNLSGSLQILHMCPNLMTLVLSRSFDTEEIFHLFPNLSYFDAHSNNLDGRMPFSLVNSRSISSLVLRNNSFSGLIDLNCSAKVNLKLLDLVDNKFTDLGGNNLTGQIPETFKNFNSLCYLSLSMCNLNNLSGSLQILHTCPNLTTLVLSRSFDSEEMSSDAKLQFKKLKTLVIPSCKLTGRTPVWLNGLTKLRILDLSWNELTGSIPPFLGSL